MCVGCELRRSRICICVFIMYVFIHVFGLKFAFGNSDRHIPQVDTVISESSDTSESDEDDHVESHPLGIDWLMSKGAQGCLHIASESEIGITSCGRRLRFPEEDLGMQRALETGRSWSPRCFSKLTEAQRKWWVDSHK